MLQTRIQALQEMRNLSYKPRDQLCSLDWLSDLFLVAPVARGWSCALEMTDPYVHALLAANGTP